MKQFIKYTICILLIVVYGCKKEEHNSVPTLSTVEISVITDSSCNSGGIIKSKGTSEILNKGVCWNTMSKPTIENNITNDGGGKEIFNSKITGLSPNTKYYVRAYATNQIGTGYGNEIQFTTLGLVPAITTVEIINISFYYADCKCNLTANGGFPILNKGICWSTNQNPTINDSITTSSSSASVFTSRLSNLSTGKTYYVRAFATNEIGTGYGNEIQFTTLGSLPTILTLETSDISYFFAKCKSNLVSNGGLTILSKGVCWSKNQNPTIDDFKTVESSNLGVFTSNLNGLEANTTYYVRAYASNEIGTNYGSTISFTTKSPETIQDFDGNVYNAIQIGAQIWTTENLRTTHYSNGDEIPLITDNTEWKNLNTGALSYYDNSNLNAPLYGALYNWFAVEDSRNLCPTGWHVPTDVEWDALYNAYGGLQLIGGKMKSTITEPNPEPSWSVPNNTATNEIGFSGFPGGYRDHLGKYDGKRLIGFWWYGNSYNPDQSSYLLLRNNSGVAETAHLKKTYGLSVRCVKD